MYTDQSSKPMWDRVILIGLAMLATGVGGWWLQKNFGSIAALVIIGGVWGIFCAWLGATHTQRTQKIALEAMADVMHETGQTAKGLYKVMEQHQRYQREHLKAFPVNGPQEIEMRPSAPPTYQEIAGQGSRGGYEYQQPERQQRQDAPVYYE